MDAELLAEFDAVTLEASPRFASWLEDDLRAMFIAPAPAPAPASAAEAEPTDRPGEPHVVVVDAFASAGRASRRRWLGAAAAIVALAIGITTLAVSRSHSGLRPSPQPSSSVPNTTTSTVAPAPSSTPATTIPATSDVPTVAATPPAQVPAHWDQLPSSSAAAPDRPLVASAGETVVVVGGRQQGDPPDGPADVVSGLVLDLATQTWHAMAPAPVPVDREAPAVWTGQSLFVLAGNGQLLSYDPKANRWRVVGSIGHPSTVGQLAWTGSEVLVASEYVPQDLWVETERAYKPATGAWRTLPASGLLGSYPGISAVQGVGVWTGTEWLRIASPTAKATPPGQLVRSFDPRTSLWLTRPAVPTQDGIGSLTMDGKDVVAVDGSGIVWRLRPLGRWRAEGSFPNGEGYLAQSAWSVDHRLVVDTWNTPNGRFVGYRQSSGAWSSLGSGISENDDMIVQTASGVLVDTDGHRAARMTPIVDPTTDIASCRSHDLAATQIVDETARDTIVLTNVSDHACTVDGQRPAVVQIRSGSSWQAMPPSVFPNQPPGADGGLLAPGGHAAMWLTTYAGPEGPNCPVAQPADAIRFSLPDGDPIEVPLTRAPSCPDVGYLMAFP